MKVKELIEQLQKLDQEKGIWIIYDSFQKYEQALERCKEEFNFNNLAYSHDEIKQKLKRVFPELKESEDEKIRKSLIEHIKGITSWNYFLGISKEQMLAWLEKQGEQKPVIIPKFRIGDYVKNVNDKREPIYEIVYMDKECYICEYRGKENMGDKTVMHFAFDNPYLRLVQKPAWSEEDEKERKRVVGLLEGWLSTFKETCYAEDCKCGIAWLKTLKPQSQWKPSKEQVEALRVYLYHPQYINNSEDERIKLVESLYNNLIKLL